MHTHSLLFQFLTMMFYWAGLIVMAIGIAITIAPERMIRLGEVLNRWVSTEEVFDNLDSARPTEKWFYRHHRSFGVVLILAAAYVLYSFAFVFDASAIGRQTLFFNSRAVTDWLVHSISFLNIGFSILAIAIGAIIFFRPSLLKGLEQWANRWYGVDESLKRLDVQLKTPDSWFRQRPRLLGVIIVAGSLYIVLSLRLFV